MEHFALLPQSLPVPSRKRETFHDAHCWTGTAKRRPQSMSCHGGECTGKAKRWPCSTWRILWAAIEGWLPFRVQDSERNFFIPSILTLRVFLNRSYQPMT